MILRVSAAESLSGSVTVPGDKSISHRALMLGAIAQGASLVRGWLPSGDCMATLNAIRSLGIAVDQQSATSLVVHGKGMRGLSPPPDGQPLDCQRSGTTIRLLAGILAGQSFCSVLDGDEGLRRRPMERVAVPLRQMGADVSTVDGKPPITISGGGLRGIGYDMPVASGQVKSAILLAALYASGGTEVRQPGPARDHTERMLSAQGVQLSEENGVIWIRPPKQELLPLNMHVPSDISSAAFPLVAGLLVPEGNVCLKGVTTNPTRTGLLDVLSAMGADISTQNPAEQAGEPVGDLDVRSSRLSGVEIGGDTVVRMIDEFPILAVAATQAEGETVVRDARELRMKESDRIASVAVELAKMGCHIQEREDGFLVRGPVRLRGAVVNSHGDHRLAMALVVAGLIADGETLIEDAAVIGDSYPGFIATMRGLGADLTVQNPEAAA